MANKCLCCKAFQVNLKGVSDCIWVMPRINKQTMIGEIHFWKDVVDIFSPILLPKLANNILPC